MLRLIELLEKEPMESFETPFRMIEILDKIFQENPLGTVVVLFATKYYVCKRMEAHGADRAYQDVVRSAPSIAEAVRILRDECASPRDGLVTKIPEFVQRHARILVESLQDRDTVYENQKSIGLLEENRRPRKLTGNRGKDWKEKTLRRGRPFLHSTNR